jgi:hypothetical protein
VENDLEVPIISYDYIKSAANTFLKEYHPNQNIPVPIEEIIEFQMKKDIIPLPGFRDRRLYVERSDKYLRGRIYLHEPSGQI